MGCNCSKKLDSEELPNPLQQLQAAEAAPRLQHRRRQEEKRQRQLAKLQKRNARKRRQQRGSANASGKPRGNSQRRSLRGSDSGSLRGSHNLAPQLRLLGGSNGSSATECVSALYARTLEQQREEHQRIIEQKTQHQLERQLHTFLLNQLLLGIQFFGHFEHELAAIDEQLLAKQRACAQTLTEHSLLHASAIDAAVAKRLLFKPMDASNSRGLAKPQPLQRYLTYVVFENVDIARANDANYDSIAALCKVLLETDYYSTTPCRSQYVQQMEQSRWLGYVRLKLREPTPLQRRLSCRPSSPSSDEGEPENDYDGVYTDGSSGYSTGAGALSSSERSSWREGDYDHVYIARLNTQRPMDELRLMRETLQPNVLPETCVRRLESCMPVWLEQSDDDDDDDDLSSESASSGEEETPEALAANRSGYETVQVLRQCRMEQQRRRDLLQQCYLSSQQFMNYFGELLRQQLAQELGISRAQLAAGSYRGCSIYTATEELVPAIHVPHSWPDCAFEFNLRARPQLTNLHTGERYQWPTTLMRKRIQSFGFHVVPVGYAPKRARNPFRELEWRIVFPQAEQFLERQLTRMQLKVLLLMKVLVRTFVNEKCQAMGHIVDQLRTHLFWQCERHSNDWPEEFLGEKLVRFVRSFADCLAKKQLSDYFIERRNLFEHVPEDALMELRAIMAGIAEQPLMHVLQALHNLQHADDFYPKLNYSRLLDNLVTQDYLKLRSLAKFTRHPRPVWEQPPQETPQQQQQQEELASPVGQGLLSLHQHQERTRGKLRRKTQMLRAQQLKLAEEQRRSSVDSLTLDMPLLMPRPSQISQTSSNASGGASSVGVASPRLNDGIEILRCTNLLELLLDHMLAMLAKATEFRNAQHAQLYLEQAQRLCRLYQQLGCSQFAQHYTDALCQAASAIERASTSNDSSPISPRGSSSASPLRRKSLKFVEHVVQLHTGELTPLQPPAIPSTPSTRRAQPPLPVPDVDAIGVEETPSAKSSEPREPREAAVPSKPAEPYESAEPAESPDPAQPSPSAVKEAGVLLSSFLQRLQVDAGALQTITSKTGQFMQTLAPEAKRGELRDLLKRKTEMVKSAFN